MMLCEIALLRPGHDVSGTNVSGYKCNTVADFARRIRGFP